MYWFSIMLQTIHISMAPKKISISLSRLQKFLPSPLFSSKHFKTPKKSSAYPNPLLPFTMMCHGFCALSDFGTFMPWNRLFCNHLKYRWICLHIWTKSDRFPWEKDKVWQQNSWFYVWQFWSWRRMVQCIFTNHGNNGDYNQHYFWSFCLLRGKLFESAYQISLFKTINNSIHGIQGKTILQISYYLLQQCSGFI